MVIVVSVWGPFCPILLKFLTFIVNIVYVEPEQCLPFVLKLSLKWSQTCQICCKKHKGCSYTNSETEKKKKTLNLLLFIFKLQERSQGRKEEEKEEGEHVDDDVDSINGEDE